VARRVPDVRHADIRAFTKDLHILRRQARELEPDPAPRETTVIHSDEECALVMRYLLARRRDQKESTTKHLDAFAKDRPAMKRLLVVMARIPAPGAS
jgi:hypothetical protein